MATSLAVPILPPEPPTCTSSPISSDNSANNTPISVPFVSIVTVFQGAKTDSSPVPIVPLIDNLVSQEGDTGTQISGRHNLQNVPNQVSGGGTPPPPIVPPSFDSTSSSASSSSSSDLLVGYVAPQATGTTLSHNDSRTIYDTRWYDRCTHYVQSLYPTTVKFYGFCPGI